MLYLNRTIIQGLSVFFFVVSLLACSSSFAFFKKSQGVPVSQDEVTFWAQMSRDFTFESSDNNPDVQRHIRWYQQHPRYLHSILIKAQPFIHYVYEQTHRYNLPAELALIPLLESHYNPAIGAPSGAAGLWQMMPGTATKFGLKINKSYDGRRDVSASTKAALTYLSYLHRYFNHNWLLALAAYDAGEGRVAAVAGRTHFNFWDLPLSKETREYVPRLLAIASIIKKPEAYNVSLPNIANESNLQELTWKEARSFNLEQAAKNIGIDDSVLRHYNPGIRQNIANIPGSLTLLVPGKNLPMTTNEQNVETTRYPMDNVAQNEAPKDNLENTVEKVSADSNQPKIPAHIKNYKIKNHDTLDKIAKQFHCSTNELKKANHLNSNKLKVGKVLIIPENSNNKALAKVSKTAKITSKKYTLKTGDSLASVAKKFHVPLKKLKQINHIKNEKRLQIGHSLTIPAH